MEVNDGTLVLSIIKIELILRCLWIQVVEKLLRFLNSTRLKKVGFSFNCQCRVVLKLGWYWWVLSRERVVSMLNKRLNCVLSLIFCGEVQVLCWKFLAICLMMSNDSRAVSNVYWFLFFFFSQWNSIDRWGCLSPVLSSWRSPVSFLMYIKRFLCFSSLAWIPTFI